MLELRLKSLRNSNLYASNNLNIRFIYLLNTNQPEYEKERKHRWEGLISFENDFLIRLKLCQLSWGQNTYQMRLDIRCAQLYTYDCALCLCSVHVYLLLLRNALLRTLQRAKRIDFPILNKIQDNMHIYATA